MTYWTIGDDETVDPRFTAAGPGACGLYHMAGAWCMRQVHYRPEQEIPPEWFIPDTWVKGWPNGVRLASRLVDVGLWYRVRGGYQYAWIRQNNTADYVRSKRAAERRKWEAKVARKQAEAGLLHLPTPQGRYRGELEPEAKPPRKRSRDARDSTGTS